MEFDIEVTNQGSRDAFDIEVTDYLPAELTLSVNDTNGWTDNGSTLTNSISYLAPSTSEILRVMVTVDSTFA